MENQKILGAGVLVIIILGIGGYLLVQGGGGGGKKEEEKTTLRMGFAVPASGEATWWYEQFVQGIHVAEHTINTQENVGHITWKHFHVDTALDPDKARMGVTELATLHSVHGVIGSTSDTIMTTHSYCKNREIPQITPMAGSGRIDPIGGEEDYLWRLCPSDTMGGVAVAAMCDINGWERAALFYEAVAASETLATTFETTAEGLEDVDIVKKLKVSAEKPSYSSPVSTALSENPDVVVIFPGPNVMTSLVKELHSQGYDGTIILREDAHSTEWLKTIKGVDMSKLYLQRPTTLIEDWRLERFSDHLEATEGHREVYHMAPYAYSNYDTAMVFSLAAEKLLVEGKDLTRKNINKTIRSVSSPPGEKVKKWEDGVELLNEGKEIDFEGMMTNCNFDDQGNVTGPFAMDEVDTDELKWIETQRIEEETLQSYWETYIEHAG